MKKIAFVIIAFCFIRSAYSQNYRNVCGFRIKQSAPDFDGYCIVNAGTGAFIYSSLRVFKIKPESALLWSIVLGYASELFIDGKQNYIFTDPDPGGADLIGDPVWRAFGAGFACILDLLLEWNRRFRMSLEMDKSSYSLCLRLDCG